MWVCRDKDGSLWIYDKKPEIKTWHGVGVIGWGDNPFEKSRFSYRIPFPDVLPEVTFENSPIEIKL